MFFFYMNNEDQFYTFKYIKIITFAYEIVKILRKQAGQLLIDFILMFATSHHMEVS